MKNLVFREIRWFFPGPIPAETWAWFKLLPGDKANAAYPRQDIYLIIPDQEELGLKVREGRFEIKFRDGPGIERKLSVGKTVGILENWTKQIWDYHESISEMVAPFKGGPRVRIVKSRNQRKYEFLENNPLVPITVDDKPHLSVAIEMVELYSEKVVTEKDKNGEIIQRKGPAMRHWTLACEAIGTPNQIDQVFDEGASKLLESYEGPVLTAEFSHGYPRFAIERYEEE